MIYELTIDGYTLGVYSPEADAVRRAEFAEGPIYSSVVGEGWRIFDVRPIDQQTLRLHELRP